MNKLLNPWNLIQALHSPWAKVDKLLANKLKTHTHHAALDSVVGWAKGESVFYPFGFFPDGWGDVNVPVNFANAIRYWEQRLVEGSFVEPLDVTTSAITADKDNAAVELQYGEYYSPLAELLPPESHQGKFELVTPKMWQEVARGTKHDDEVANMAARRPVAIILAGTGEQGFKRRRQLMAYPLAERGVASLILESPYYGCRRPPHQKASKLRSVSDLPVLGRATIEESHGLIMWLRAQEKFGPITLAGNSMGGLHSAITAAFTPFPVGVASYLGPTSAAPVFTEGVLAKACEWKVLAAQSTDPTLENCLRLFEDTLLERVPEFKLLAERIDPSTLQNAPYKDKVAFAHLQMKRFLQLTNLTNFPVPVQPDAAEFVVAQFDQYVPASTMLEHWNIVQRKWKGAKIHWVKGGHVSAIIFPPESFADKVVAVTSRLPDP